MPGITVTKETASRFVGQAGAYEYHSVEFKV